MTALALAAGGAGCGGGVPVDVANGSASAGCETATEALLVESPGMLPGRRCLVCHTTGMSAGERPYAAAGTVFGSASATTCNEGGVGDVLVELLKSDGSVAASATTNSAGNFHMPGALNFPLKARVTINGKKIDMPGSVTTGDCASCHNTTIAPRIWAQ